MITIYPYKLPGSSYMMIDRTGIEVPGLDVWVFDDEQHGLHQEALISGTDEVIEFVTKDIPDAEKGFKLIFSDEMFENYQLVGYWYKAGYAKGPWASDIKGNWYLWNLPFQNNPKIYGWLCLALFLYFETAPSKLYIRVEPIKPK